MSDEQLNFFAQHGRESMTAPARAKMRAADKRAMRKARIFEKESDVPLAPTRAEKKLQDELRQLTTYHRWKRSQIKAHMLGPLGANFHDLTKLLRQLTIDDSGQLVAYVKEAKWLRGADLDSRYMALSLIASAIVRLRVRDGRDPFDDSLPGEEPTAFELIRAMLILRPSDRSIDAHHRQST